VVNPGSVGAPTLRATACWAVIGDDVEWRTTDYDVPATIDAIGAHVNLMPSQREESFGLAAVEGMACSCLTITTGRGGLAAIAQNTGAWSAGQPEAWLRLTDRIRASSRDVLAAESRRQHERAVAHYHPSRFNAALDTIFV